MGTVAGRATSLAVPPPPSVATPAALWRGLLAVPRASRALRWRVPGLSHPPLVCRALRGAEWAAAMSEPEPALALVAASVWLDGEPAFAGAADVASMTASEAAELTAEVLAVLAAISPTYTHSDTAAWEAALHQGARAHENVHDAIWLGQCVDTSAGFSVVYTTPRPDRYFGLPIGELTDGHQMAFAAARRVVEELRPKHDHR